ncbi:MAG: F0F1 ATP synthase subunit delta [Patescibacteria group bacterium]
MKYSAQAYADALVEVLSETKGDTEAIARRFAELVRRNGDTERSDSILSLAERTLARREGGRVVLLEFARAPRAETISELAKRLNEKDVIETRVAPELIAGVRITIDGGSELDLSLRGKLKRLFSSRN